MKVDAVEQRARAAAEIPSRSVGCAHALAGLDVIEHAHESLSVASELGRVLGKVKTVIGVTAF